MMQGAGDFSYPMCIFNSITVDGQGGIMVGGRLGWCQSLCFYSRAQLWAGGRDYCNCAIVSHMLFFLQGDLPWDKLHVVPLVYQ
jgi:hypothetical protein